MMALWTCLAKRTLVNFIKQSTQQSKGGKEEQAERAHVRSRRQKP
jgi:hypothetical protein